MRCPAVLLLPILALSPAPLSAQGPAPADHLDNPEAVLAAARATNGLNADDLKPWHLKANYQLFDDDGKPLGKGVFEAEWVAKDRWKFSYAGDHYTGAIYRSGEGYAQQGDAAPWPERLIPGALIEPIVETAGRMLKPQRLRPRKGTSPPLTCMDILSTQWSVHADSIAAFNLTGFSNWPTGANLEDKPPYTYCFDAGSIQLRVREAEFITSVYPTIGNFHGHFVGMQTEVQVNRQTLVRLKVTALATSLDNNAALSKETSSLKFEPKEGPISYPPKYLSGDHPKVPQSFAKRSQGGKVLMLATIDKTGRISEAHPLESSDQILADAARTGVATWRYRPAMRNGQPAEIQMLLRVDVEK